MIRSKHALLDPVIMFVFGASILDTSSTSSTSQTMVVSGPVLLVLAWAVCAILILAGKARTDNRFFASGIIGTGIMTVATPLVYYVYETLRLGVFAASVQDFFLLAVLSALGGGIIMIGIRRVMGRRVSPALRERA